MFLLFKLNYENIKLDFSLPSLMVFHAKCLGYLQFFVIANNPQWPYLYRTLCTHVWELWGFQVLLVVKNPPANARDTRHGFDPRVGKIPWRRAWQLTPMFLPGESYGQRSLAGYSPCGCRVRHDWSDIVCTHTHMRVSLMKASKVYRIFTFIISVEKFC